MRYFAFVLGLLLLAGSAFAADIDGKWTGTMAGGLGSDPMQITYTFKADGNTLTGSTPGMEGKDMVIKDGKINGNNISYSIIFNFGQEMKVDFKGVLSGDTLKVSFEMMGQPMELVLKKAK
jgi:hypothetical protein